MIVEQTSLCRFIACCWCRNRGVDRTIAAKSDEQDRDKMKIIIKQIDTGTAVVVVDNLLDDFSDNPAVVDEDNLFGHEISCGSSTSSCSSGGELEKTNMKTTITDEEQRSTGNMKLSNSQDSSWWGFMSRYTYFKRNQDVVDKINVDDSTRTSKRTCMGKEKECNVAPPNSTFHELIEAYEYEGKKVDMSKPRGCSYNRHQCHKEKKIPLGKIIPRVKTANRQAQYTSMPVELRGITLRQLRAVYANIVERCEREGWVNDNDKRLTPDTVTLYEVNKYIVLPFTEDSQASFVESLPSTCGTQPPRIYMSHWFGMPLKDTISCLEQMKFDFRWNRNDEDDARGGGMSEDTPIWIDIFANNQRKLGEEISSDISKSSFVKASETSEFRTVTILDTKGIIFTRMWCVLEIFLTLTKTNGVWAIYTAHKHSIPLCRKQQDVIGIVLGGAPGEAADDTYIREESFPRELILQSFTAQLESANATRESDRRSILNFMSGNEDNPEAEPPTIHDAFTKLNDAFKGAFAASVPALKASLATGEDEWKKTLAILSKGIQTNTFILDFQAFTPPLSSEQAYDLISHVPMTCTGLLLTNIIGETMVGASGGVIEWVKKAKNVKEIIFFNCRVGDDEKGQMIGSHLVHGLTSSKCTETLEHFYVTNTDLIASGNISDLAPLVFKKMKSMIQFHVMDEWNRTLATLSKGRMTQAFKVDFSSYDHPLSSKEAQALISQIPITCTHLHLSNAVDSETTIGTVRGVVEWLRNAKEIREVIFINCNVGDGEDGRVVGSEVANELMESSCTSTMEYFHIINTDIIVSGNISEWASALRQMKNLFEFKCVGRVGLSEKDVEILSYAAYESGSFASFKE